MNIIHCHYMSNILKSIDYINKAYDGLTYFDIYGGSVFVCALLIYLLILYYQYMKIELNIEPVRKNWSAHRCSPVYMPFAGYIMRPKDTSWFKFAGNNATYCINQILASIAGNFMKPILFILYPILGMWKIILSTLQAIRKLFATIRTHVSSIVANIMNRVSGFIIVLQKMTMSLTDMFAKMRGVFVAGIYTAIGSYYAVKSALGALLVLCIIFLIVLAAAVIIAWILPWTWWLAISLTVAFVALMVPLAYTTTWMAILMDIRPGVGMPGKPGSCFVWFTPIKLNDGRVIPISEIRHGDILYDGGVVTSCMTLLKDTETVGKLDGIFVSGSHYVMHDNKWIQCIYHPDFNICMESENNDIHYLYCLGVSTKKIHIGSHIFADWDDMIKPGEVYYYNKQLEELPLNVNIEGAELYNGAHIHTFFEGGLYGETIVLTSDQHRIPIKDIKLGAEIGLGNIVTGLVVIDGSDIEQYHHLVKSRGENNHVIKGSGNIIYNTNVRNGTINKSTTITNFLDKKSVNNQDKRDILYHLITTLGEFKVDGGLVISDYNACLDYFDVK